MAKITKPFKIHGGKHYLAPKIISLMPPHKHYVEPYAGGLSVLLARSGEGISEVVNDLDNRIWNFWHVLREPQLFKLFKRRIQATPFSRKEFERALRYTSVSSVSRAVDFFIIMRQSRQGIGQSFATLSRNRTRKDMNEQVSSWLSSVEGLTEVHTRLKRVVVENVDALELIKKEDGKHTFFYLDPPYLPSTRTSIGQYACEMTVREHKSLLTTLEGVVGKFLLSGYPSSLYSKWAYSNGFQCVEVKIDNKASSKRLKGIKTECLWKNY